MHRVFTVLEGKNCKFTEMRAKITIEPSPQKVHDHIECFKTIRRHLSYGCYRRRLLLHLDEFE